MAAEPEILARGPWKPGEVRVLWREAAFEPGAAATAEADRNLQVLGARGSPTYDGPAARMVSYAQTDSGLELELQPTRWSLRLSRTDASDSLSALCVVRDARGGWLAGRRAGWVASWAGRWALGAGGSVEVGEHPARTLERELVEEWGVYPERLQVEALVRPANRMVMFVGQAWLAAGAAVTPDHEHDQFSWWPPEIGRWPAEADPELRAIGALVSSAPIA
ncbi:MAG: NUDIX hydrolase [Actinomycetota bacterium]|nr:NUDIX hydrolase [Actinomycetota bacterium]